MQNITTNLSTKKTIRNRSIAKKTEGTGFKKDYGAVYYHPLANLTPTQIRQKSRDLIKVNERLVSKIPGLKSMNSQLQQDLYGKAAELQFQESHNNEQLK